MALPHHPMMSVEEYLTLDRNNAEARYEYIDGLISMLAGGTLRHALIGVNVTRILYGLLLKSPCRVYNSDSRVQLSETRYVYPDATVSCNEDDQEDDIISAPKLVVEILSPSTENYDRGQKFVFYRECPGIQEYMLIETQRPSIEVFRREKHAFWTLHIFGSEENVTLHSLGITFPVEDIYEGITFKADDQPS